MSKPKFYKFEFKKVDIFEEDDATGGLRPAGFLDYRMTARDILLNPVPGTTGLSNDQLDKSLAITRRFKDAHIEGKKFALLDEEDVAYLKSRVKSWQWGRANEVAVKFRSYVESLEPEKSAS